MIIRGMTAAAIISAPSFSLNFMLPPPFRAFSGVPDKLPKNGMRADVPVM